MEPTKVFSVETVKGFRVEIDKLMQALENESFEGTEDINKIENLDHRLHDTAVFTAFIKLTEAKMWLGKVLEAYNNPLPKEFADKHEGAAPSIDASTTS